MPSLFDPLQAGAFHLKNRIVMAPLTRCRAVDGRVPNTLMRDYYVQRASAGMILTEATAVTPMGVGYPDTPGIWNEAQVAGWRMITDAVHKAGGLIVLQLWHVGRISDPEHLNGAQPVAPSAIAANGHVSLLRPIRPYPVPRALDTDEIPAIVEAYRQGAANAKRAGFDGVEIHGANGYLPDQFLQDSTNKRTDRYGGPIENRARFMLEITDAAIGEWGADRVGMHLNLRMSANSMGDSNPVETFDYVARELNKRRIAFIFGRESLAEPRLGPMVKQEFGGVYIANESLTPEDAARLVETGEVDAASFGRPFIANPDLVERLRRHAPLATPDKDTFYTKGPAGYTDYPALEPAAA